MASPCVTVTEAGVWYFAYGSNISSSVMKKRGMSPLGIKLVTVPSHILTFNVFGVPYIEPSMAGIAERPPDYSGPSVHGAAYLLTDSDYHRLIISEGAGVGYREIEVDAFVLGPEERGAQAEDAAIVTCRGRTETLRVQTLVARYPFRPEALPSTRYISLIIDGAVQQGLPGPYVEYLRSLPRYSRALTPTQELGVRLFSAFWMPLLSRLMRQIKSRADDRGNVPEWMGWCMNAVFRTMWLYHDTIHCRIWRCNGGRRAKSDA